MTDRKRRLVSVNPCLTSDDCDVGDMCNMDWGEDGGLCETCPGNTENDCYDAGFNQQLETDECLNVCVGQASEYSNDILLLISYYLKFWNGDCSIFLITKIYLDSYICTCLPGFSATEVNENGAAKCEADCVSNNGICQLDAHCPQECSCPSGYEVVN